MTPSTKSNRIMTEPNIGKRFLAGFVDYLIIYTFIFLILYIYGEPDSSGEYSVTGIPALFPLLFWGIMTIGMELWFGATIGNSLVGLKPIPISEQNRKLSFGESLKRHLLDPIDMFFFGLIGIIAINNTERNQRVGDLWAKTLVVKTENLKESI
ncbi:RDD family protein [uncultured Aquimarina sp.]|uniref:RDD family protein n=1 Tax=uncultured Aquimarina sp. TaxID=575652 RepID=UPI00261BE9B4|nr:RDD family protein [uncultured Aquimarina sp.]